MSRSSLALLLFAFGASALPVTAIAQGHAPDCVTLVESLCKGNPPGRCFQREALWDEVPEHCIGDIQTMIEIEREAAIDDALSRQDVRDLEGNVHGRSYGGRLRSGPGSDHASVGSLQEGERIRILENTGARTDDYDWYRVLTVHGEAYHWGGLFCSEPTEPLEGVLTVCGSEHERSLFGGDGGGDVHGVTLRPDGVALAHGGTLPFGTPTTPALDRLTSAFGVAPGVRDLLDDCGAGQLDYASWDNGFAAYFRDERFVGWTAIDQRTAEGIGFGSTRDDLMAAYAPRFTHRSLGVEFSAGNYAGSLESDQPDARISDFRAGLTCVMH